MQINKLREYLQQNYPTAIIFDNPAFDDSIIGISNTGSLIYDKNAMAEELAAEEDMDILEALDFIEFNTERTIPYITEGEPPIILETSFVLDKFERLPW